MHLARQLIHLALTSANSDIGIRYATPRYRQTAPGTLAPQVHNLPSRRHRRSVWKTENIASRSAGQAAIKWNQTSLRHDGQHHRSAA